MFALAAERSVPILIHGGRGLPPIADHLRRLVDANPGAQLIIAHAGIADLAALAAAFGGMAGVFFDTSVWSPIDLLGLYHLVSPEQVLYASDYPYGQQPSSLLIALRTARIAGLDEEQMRGDALRHREPDRRRRAAARAERADREQRRSRSRWRFARIHQYLSMATPLLWTRQADTIGVLGLALNATAPTGTATRRSATGSASCSRPRATSGACCRRSTTRASSASSAARRFGSSTSRTSWR